VDWIDHGGLRACDQYALHCHPAVQQDEIGKNVCKIQSRLRRGPPGYEDSLARPNTGLRSQSCISRQGMFVLLVERLLIQSDNGLCR